MQVSINNAITTKKQKFYRKKSSEQMQKREVGNSEIFNRFLQARQMRFEPDEENSTKAFEIGSTLRVGTVNVSAVKKA